MELLDLRGNQAVQHLVELVPNRLFWATVDIKSFVSTFSGVPGVSLMKPRLKPNLSYRANTTLLEQLPAPTGCSSPKKKKQRMRSRAPAIRPEGLTIICTDKVLRYRPLANDFGPLDLPTICRYLDFVEEMLQSGNPVVHVTDHRQRSLCANSAFLVSVSAHIHFGLSPREIETRFNSVPGEVIPAFRDASRLPSCSFPLKIRHFIEAIRLSMRHRWIDWNQVRVGLIEKLQSVEHGDLNWIIENKFLAFAGPSSDRLDEDGLEVHPPAYYAKLFKRLAITDVVRLNVPNYHPSEFHSYGIQHHDLFFEDGSCPPPEIVEAFLRVVKQARGAIAVHCKAGLGRTASLIGVAVMQEYKVPAHIFIAWARIARPGSVIGPQQHFLVEMEERLLPKSKRKIASPEKEHRLGSESQIGLLGDQGQGDFLLRQKRRWNARSPDNST